MSTHTIRLHRVLKASPALVYKAFLDPDALSRWLPPNGYLCKVFHLDPKVGGAFKMAFTQFSNGHSHSFGGEYLELVPNELIRYTDVFEDPNLPGTIEVTVKLKAVSCGTDLSVTQAGVPAVIPEEACYLGWQDSLLHLAGLVEGGATADECP
ncbi:MAG: SRPBCC family protein [Terrimicrobiaceae bacterium]